MRQLLPIGTPIRNVRHPELTGRIKNHEWRSHDEISAIPYLIDWDDSSAAHGKLGFLHVYATIEGVEPVPVAV